MPHKELSLNSKNIVSKKEAACQIFASGFNCSQAVLAVFCEDFGLEKSIAYKISTGFGGGLRQGEVCGAVTGAVMAIGLYKGHHVQEDTENKEATYELTKKVVELFKEKHSSIICRSLLGLDLADEQQYQTIKEQELFKKKCPNYVADAVQIVEELTNSKKV